MKALLQRSSRILLTAPAVGFTCQDHRKDVSYCETSTPSWLRRNVVSWVYPLPFPRPLIAKDPIFCDSTHRSGLRQREHDAKILQALLRNKPDNMDITTFNELAYQITAISYGKGLTPQDRENFLAVSLHKEKGKMEISLF